MKKGANIAVVGGTEFDAALGQKWLAKKGVAATAIGMSTHPKAQAQLYLQPKKLKAVFHEKVGGKNFEHIIIYCNSLSFAADWRSMYGERITELRASYKAVLQNIAHKNAAILVAEPNMKKQLEAFAAAENLPLPAAIMPRIDLILQLEQANDSQQRQLILDELKALKNQGFSEVVFGCTHFDHPDFYTYSEIKIHQPGLTLIEDLAKVECA